MGLQTYLHKRKFGQTPEPKGAIKPASGDLRFVVQKHQASHLHYDFRLEMEGVLKSWAVPKGPSLNPKDKRLAMMVEDHPFSYKDFEGTIPAGNYGAGNVIVWDRGTYYAPEAGNKKENENLLLRGLRDGHINFFLEGEKLKGAFSLVKFKGAEKNAWLLVKKDDAYAGQEDVLENTGSVLSGKIIAPKNKPKTKTSKKPELALPHGIKPMLATLVDKPFDRPNWLFEIKWDGYRAIAEIDGAITLLSRSGKTFNEKYPELVKDLGTIRRQAILDGEIVAVDKQGKPNFQMLQNYEKNGGTLVYYVFDLLFLDGENLRKRTLRDRKQILKTIIPKKGSIRLSEAVEKRGCELFALAEKQGIEGIVAKDADSPYLENYRGEEWLKIKTHKRQEAIICGFTEPKGSRHYFGSLVLGIYKDGALHYAGNTGSGFNQTSLKTIHAKLLPLITDSSPFDYKVTAPAPITWVKPKLLCEAEFTEWTEDYQMRHPIFQGLRDDKSPEEVTIEKEKHTTSELSSPKMKKNVSVIKTHTELTNLDKIYWPKEGYTKGDLVRYYADIAPIILPYLKDRPESLLRHPNGMGQEGFFQKNILNVPDFAKTAAIETESEEKKVHYLLCQNKDTLLYMANLGCIEINPWNSRTQKLEYPDYAVLDLDPGDIKFSAVVDVALAIHELLEKIGAVNFCKTSGKTGLHIFIPLDAKYTHEQSRLFSHVLAEAIHAELPKTTSLVRIPSKRQKCIYIDYLQNRIGQTLAAPYSVRPHPGATVSTPLKWKEVNKNLDPAQFTLKTILKRLDKVGDLWQPVLGKGIDLKKLIPELTNFTK